MGTTATAQINARIDPELKARGDEALAAAGLSPTQAIRALWELAARNADRPDAIGSALCPDRDRKTDAARESRRAARLAAAQRGPTIVAQAYPAIGIQSHDAPAPELSYDELKELAHRSS